MKDKLTAPADAAIFPKEDLIANSRVLFNQPPEVVAGALLEVSEPITIEDAKASIDNYLTRPIRTEGSN